MSFEDIIQQVQGRPEIWQFTHPRYNNQVRRRKIWREISKELNTNDELVKKRWKHLMDQYRKELKKLQKKTSNGEEALSNWLHFDSLAFLKDEMEMRIERDRLRAGGSDSDERNEDDVRSERVSYKESMEQDDSTTFNPSNYLLPSSYETSTESTDKITSPVSKADLILKRLQHLTMIVNRNQKDQLKEDDDYMFLMSILPTMRSLSSLKKLEFKSKVSNFLMQAIAGEDPLNQDAQGISFSSAVPQFVVSVEQNEDNKDSLKSIMETDGNDDNS